MTNYPKLRIIIVSDENGENEMTTFTEDFVISANNFCVKSQTVDTDVVIENMQLPSSFPIETELVKQ
jgi:hypothetical protein